MPRLLIAFACLWVSSVVVAADSAGPAKLTVDFDQGKGTVEFRAIGHPSAIKIVGKGAAPHGIFTVSGGQISGEARFDLTSLDTGIEMRNRHMKEKYLEVEKYPQAKLVITSLPFAQSSQGDFAVDSVPFSGTLSLHGKDHPVSGTAHVEKKGGQISMKATFTLKVDDYGIDIPKFAGITMADDVEITVENVMSTGKSNP